MTGIIGVIPVNTEKYGIPYTPPPNRTKIICEMCGEKCWIDPEQKNMKATNPSFPVLCPQCLRSYNPDLNEDEIKYVKLSKE